ncbi:MAG: helix-turn-helix transcriptional regulator [Clostridia bacterium]|nr:helix-turn-helix transcriptional regulator [Clostridia bacterium]
MANNLAKYRAKKGLNQRELGEKLGLGDATISLAEHSKLPVKTALKASEILDVNVFTLLGTDVLRLIPKTEEDKQALIEIIRNI